MASHRSLLALVVATSAACSAAQVPPSTSSSAAGGRTTAAITANDLRTRVYIYADDSLMGRRVGTIYNAKATDYIAREAQRLGLTPAGDNGTFFQTLPIVRRELAAGTALTIDGRAFQAWTDFLPRDGGPTQRDVNGAQVIYGGVFGDTARMLPRNSPDVAGKVVVFILPPAPDGVPRWQANRGQLLQFYINAAGVVVGTLDAMPAAVRAELSEAAVGFDQANPNMPPIPSFMYTTAAMTRALLGADPATLTRGAAGRTVSGSLRFTGVPASARNVVAVIPGSDPSLRGTYVALGSHNDHVGFDRAPVDHDSLRAFNAVVRPGGADSPNRPASAAEMARVRTILDSLRRIRPARLDSIYNGADDDASGSMAMLEIAEAFAAARVKPRRSLLFVWHTGEESGLWGANYFTEHPTVPRDSIVAQLNMDMIGRGGADDTPGGGPGYVQLIGSRRLSTQLGDLVEEVGRTQAVPARFDYQFDANGHPQQYYCRSDHYEYAKWGIPVVFFSTGGHRDYHQVTDEAQYIDYAQLARVTTLIHDVAKRVGDMAQRPVIDKPKPDPRGQCVQ